MIKFWYVKDSFEWKCQLLINRREKVGKENFVLLIIQLIIDNVYGNLKDYNPKKKRKVLIVCDDMMADVESKKKYFLLLLNCFYKEGHSILHLFLYHSLLSKCLKL